MASAGLLGQDSQVGLREGHITLQGLTVALTSAADLKSKLLYCAIFEMI